MLSSNMGEPLGVGEKYTYPFSIMVQAFRPSDAKLIPADVGRGWHFFHREHVVGTTVAESWRIYR